MTEEELLQYYKHLLKKVLEVDDELGEFSGLDMSDLGEAWESLKEEIKEALEYESISL